MGKHEEKQLDLFDTFERILNNLSKSDQAECDEEIKLIDKVIAKAYPKKPESQRYHNVYGQLVGVCNCKLLVREVENYCPDCGQKLDWSGEDE